MRGPKRDLAAIVYWRCHTKGLKLQIFHICNITISQGKTRKITIDSEVYTGDDLGSDENLVDETENEQAGDGLDIGEDEQMRDIEADIDKNEDEREDENGDKGDGSEDSDGRTFTMSYSIRNADPDIVDENRSEEEYNGIDERAAVGKQMSQNHYVDYVDSEDEDGDEDDDAMDYNDEVHREEARAQ